MKIFQGFGVQFTCAKNPCVGQPLSCACAKSLCNGPGLVCDGSTDGKNLTCSCPVCV